MTGNHDYHKLVKASYLAELLDVSVRTVRSYQKEGRIPYVRISSGTVRFDVDEVMAALEQRKVPARTTRSTKPSDQSPR
jgi:excisionase family DNA binding protein